MTVRKKPYLLTGGLSSLLVNRHRVGLSESISQSLEILEIDYALDLGKILNGYSSSDAYGSFTWEVNLVSGDEIERELRRMVFSARNGRPVVSFDDVYCPDIADAKYHVTRLMNPSDIAGETRLGARFCQQTLEEQVTKLRDTYGCAFDIMDIGAFEGQTLIGEFQNRFKSIGLEVHNVYLAFAGPEGLDNLKRAGVIPKVARILDWVDWVEIRDCVGLDGRKIALEHHSSGTANAFIPYCENSGKWASIPPEFQDRFRTMYFEYFDKIRSTLGKEGHNIELAQSEKYSCVRELRLG